MSVKEYKILITGASGLLGRAIYKYFTDEAFQKQYPLNETEDKFLWSCVGLCHSRVKNGLKPLDLTDFQKVDDFINEFKPNAIIHCAAERKVENVEGNFEKALQLNSGVTEHLAQLCEKNRIVFVYISTDYVFDGTKPPYKIDDSPNPLNKYGISKLQGELVTKKASEKHCIVRVPVLYGHTEPNRFDESAVNVLIGKVKKSDPYQIDDTQTRYPTHCIDVARFCMQLLKKRLPEDSNSTTIKGVFHCSNLESFTKYGISCLMADLYGLSKSHIQQDFSALNDKGPNLRPQNSQLETEYSYKLIDFKPIMIFKDSIKDCLENFV